MTKNIKVDRQPVPANKSARLTGTIMREDGVTAFKPDVVRLTVFDQTTGNTINGRNAVDITTSVSAGGVLDVGLLPADTAIVTSGNTKENHSALIEWEWNGGVDKGGYRIDYTVETLK